MINHQSSTIINSSSASTSASMASMASSTAASENNNRAIKDHRNESNEFDCRRNIRPNNNIKNALNATIKTKSVWAMMVWMAFIVVVVVVPTSTNALVCYETDENGQVTLKNTTNNFCVFSPDSLDAMPSSTPETAGVSKYSVGPKNDAVESYQKIFDLSQPGYAILTMCILEEYRIGGIDYMFRCFCNTDRCNKGKNMVKFIDHLVDSQP